MKDDLNDKQMTLVFLSYRINKNIKAKKKMNPIHNSCQNTLFSRKLYITKCLPWKLKQQSQGCTKLICPSLFIVDP